MKKHKYIFINFLLMYFTLFFCNATIAQEKKSFLQNRFDGFTETITKDFTIKNLKDFKKNLAKESLFFTYSNLKFNKHKEIIKITISIKNNKSNSEVTFYDNGKPIPNIEVGEVNGIVIATPVSTVDFKSTVLKSNKKSF